MLGRLYAAADDAPTPTVDPVLPALDGASVAGLVPALFGRVDDVVDPRSRPGRPTQVVLLVLDGLGLERASQEHRGVDARRSRAMDGGPITTVAPVDHRDRAHVDRDRARARAARHRRLPDARRRATCSTCCAGRCRAAAGRPIRSTCSATTAFLGREVPVVTRTEFRDTGFTQAHLRGGRFVGWHTTATLIEQCVRRGRSGRAARVRVLPGRRHDRARVRAARPRVPRASSPTPIALVGELLDALPADARAARHVGSRAGAPRTRVVDRDPRARGALRPRWPATAASATSTPTRRRASELLAAARDAVGDRAWVWSRAEVLELGLFGDGRDRHRARPHRQRRARGARAGRVRRSRAARTSARCARGTAASRPTRCTCRCSRRRGDGDDRRSVGQRAPASVDDARRVSRLVPRGRRAQGRRRCRSSTRRA